MKRNVEAEAVLREAAAALEKIAASDWKRYYAENLLGAAIAEQKRFAEAEPLLVSGYNGMVKNQSTLAVAEQKYLRRAADRIVHFFEITGKPLEAASWRSKSTDCGGSGSAHKLSYLVGRWRAFRLRDSAF